MHTFLFGVNSAVPGAKVWPRDQHFQGSLRHQDIDTRKQEVHQFQQVSNAKFIGGYCAGTDHGTAPKTLRRQLAQHLTTLTPSHIDQLEFTSFKCDSIEMNVAFLWLQEALLCNQDFRCCSVTEVRLELSLTAIHVGVWSLTHRSGSFECYDFTVVVCIVRFPHK